MEDCRAGRPEGWRYFVGHVLPACLSIVRHYQPNGNDPESVERLLLSLRDDPSSPIVAGKPMSERELLFGLREFLLAGRGSDEQSAEAEAQTFTKALEPLTLTEKQIVWLTVLGYDPDRVAGLMGVTRERTEAVLSRAAELLGAPSMRLAPGSRIAVVTSRDGEPQPLRAYLDVIDGRVTWADRQDVEKKAVSSWFEIDRFCRVREADAALREASPLDEEQVERLLGSLGVGSERRSIWQRIRRAAS